MLTRFYVGGGVEVASISGGTQGVLRAALANHTRDALSRRSRVTSQGLSEATVKHKSLTKKCQVMADAETEGSEYKTS